MESQISILILVVGIIGFGGLFIFSLVNQSLSSLAGATQAQAGATASLGNCLQDLSKIMERAALRQENAAGLTEISKLRQQLEATPELEKILSVQIARLYLQILRNDTDLVSAGGSPTLPGTTTAISVVVDWLTKAGVLNYLPNGWENMDTHKQRIDALAVIAFSHKASGLRG